MRNSASPGYCERNWIEAPTSTRPAWISNTVPRSRLTPLYWMLMSYSGWRALFQFFSNPFYWEKTQHGLVQKQTL